MKKEKIPDHKHRSRPAHSPEQERMFFGLVGSLGYDANEAKERAKKRFKVECFNAITKTQINDLIERLLTAQERRDRQMVTNRHKVA